MPPVLMRQLDVKKAIYCIKQSKFMRWKCWIKNFKVFGPELVAAGEIMIGSLFKCINYLQEPGRYFFGIGLYMSGPHLHSVIVTPGWLVSNAVPLTKGAN